MHMITVGNIILICHTFNNAESLLQTLRKLVGRRFHRSPVYGIADVLRLSPLLTFIIQPLHHRKGERPCFRIGMGFSKHPHTHLIQSRISQRNRGITVV